MVKEIIKKNDIVINKQDKAGNYCIVTKVLDDRAGIRGLKNGLYYGLVLKKDLKKIRKLDGDINDYL